MAEAEPVAQRLKLIDRFTLACMWFSPFSATTIECRPGFVAKNFWTKELGRNGAPVEYDPENRTYTVQTGGSGWFVFPGGKLKVADWRGRSGVLGHTKLQYRGQRVILNRGNNLYEDGDLTIKYSDK